MKVTIIPIVIGGLGTVTGRLIKGLNDLEIRRTSRDYRKFRITEIGQNTKCLGDLRRFAVTQTPVKDHQLTLM